MRQREFGAVLGGLVAALPHVTAIVKQRGDDAEAKQRIIHRLFADAAAFVTVDEARHCQRHFQHMLGVVVRGVAGVITGEFAAIQLRHVAECLVELFRGCALIEIAVDAINLGGDGGGIGRFDLPADVIFVTTEIHGWPPANT